MSKNNMGYMGDQIGKLGTAVGRKWKRKMVYAAYQKNVRNPKTDDQMLVRARFTMLTGLSQRFYPATKLGLQAMSSNRQCTEGNCFLNLNYGHVSGNTPETLEVSLPALEVSSGPVPAVNVGASLNVSQPNKVTVQLTYTDPTNPFSSTDDVIYAFAYCPAVRQGRLSDGVARRTDDKVSVENLPASWSGLEVYVYVFVVGGKKSHYAGYASQTIYAGSDELA